MLRLLDHILTLLHLSIIGFNLLGWIFPKARKWHLYCVLLTAASWLILGIWFGLGYCPITDWQWDVKRKLGETTLPNSFITYYVEHITGHNFDDQFIDTATAISFIAVALISLYLNFFRKRP
jgi:hypothetical protein